MAIIALVVRSVRRDRQGIKVTRSIEEKLKILSESYSIFLLTQ
jgi:hypothetical protein